MKFTPQKSRRRKALTRRDFDYFRWRYVSNGRRTLKAWCDTAAHRDTVCIAGELTKCGIFSGASDQFLAEEGREALVEASDLVLGISRRSDIQASVTNRCSTDHKDYLVQLIPWEYAHSADSPLLRVALDRKLLEIVSLYLGMRPHLHAIGAWLNFPSADGPKQSQLWHRDPEDLQIIKAFIYLMDVGVDQGPFCYIPGTHPFGPQAGLNPKHVNEKRITDEEMLAATPEGAWMTCTGAKHTMILADTVGFHRGGKPTKGNRILITFTYTSGTPLTRRQLCVKGPFEWATDAIQRDAL